MEVSQRSLVTGRWPMFALVAVLAFLASCATSFDKRGRFHSVRRGETIWNVARAYRVDAQTIAEYNNLEDPADVHAGMKLYIPDRPRRPGFKRLPSSRGHASKYRRQKKGPEETGETIAADHARFHWPVDGPILSGFGYRNGRRHDGVDIKSPEGTAIKAADDGKVVFSGKMRGYGNLILIRHRDDFFSAYAHNSVNMVKKGAEVKVHQVIGKVGRTGRTTGPHLHFEVRNGQVARNPLFFLPKRAS